MDERGFFNVVLACSAATWLGMRLLFVGEWDGSLSLSFAFSASRDRFQGCPRPLPLPMPPLIRAARRLGGTDAEVHENRQHAKEKRVQQLMDAYLNRGAGGIFLGAKGSPADNLFAAFQYQRGHDVV